MKNEPVISVIVPCHAEDNWLKRAARSVFMSHEPPPYELIVVIDKAAQNTTSAVAELVTEAPTGVRVQPITVDHGDLGESRNAGVREARGRFVCFLDADDGFGFSWLRQAFEYARRFDHDNFILHQQWSVMFGAANFIHRHYGENDQEFSQKDLIQYNAASALIFAPKALLERFPYRRMDPPWGFEDWHHYCETMGAGVAHHCVPGSVEMIRMKLNESSLAARMTLRKGALGYMPLFDKHNLRESVREPQIAPPPPDVMRQVHFFHYKVGEFQCQADGNTQIRVYPRQSIFDDQAYLRDSIGDAKHVVLAHELKPGGAEKYALDWCEAMKENGKDVVLIETQPGHSPWLERAEKIVKVIRWHKRRPLEPQQVAYAAQRAMIQAQLDSLFVCNSELGWALVHENAEVLAKKVIAASFSTFPLPNGFTSCPPFYLEKIPDNLTILTDNDRHAERLRRFGISRIVVVPPSASYGGTPKLRQASGARQRLLWAGRGTPEKGPHIPVLLAALLQNTADIHIWGDVQPILHALPNLHYRGPFLSFDAIEGSYDAYLLTSAFEGMPNTALEAVLAGLPVIASDVGDVAKIAAITFPPPLTSDTQKHASDAALAVSEFFMKRAAYKHATPLAIVEGWRRTFAARVAELV